MKKLNKVAMLLATAAMATAAGAQTIDNWRNGTSELVWKNGTNELCWRDANWTPATAAAGCDGAIVAKPAAAAAPAARPAAPAAPAASAPAARPAAAAPAPAVIESDRVGGVRIGYLDCQIGGGLGYHNIVTRWQTTSQVQCVNAVIGPVVSVGAIVVLRVQGYFRYGRRFAFTVCIEHQYFDGCASNGCDACQFCHQHRWAATGYSAAIDHRTQFYCGALRG